MNTFHSNVKRNFDKIDSILRTLPFESDEYHMLFSIRTYYSFWAERKLFDKKAFRFYIKSILKWIILLILFPFSYMKFTKKEDKVILGNWHFDDYLSGMIDIRLLKYKTLFSLYGFVNRLKIIPKIIVFSFKTLTLLDKGKAVVSSPQIFYFYRALLADVRDIKTIIVENDIYPVNYGILLAAQRNNIVRVKIEYAIIDSVIHQNCFCDYYFYPTIVHRKIRENCPYNSQLKYIEGGYLNKFNIVNSSYEKPENMVITYFTEHGDFFEKNDLFYIDDILKVLPVNGIINIKIHPYDKIERYSKYQKNNNIRLYRSTDINNADLISKSSICLSIFSTMSLESKYICNNSYFINYEIGNSPYEYDYSIFNTFFDTINSSKKLYDVLNGKYNPRTIEEFHQNVNITFPNTFEIFKTFINNLKE
jgi:hypothetical protein